MCAKFSLVYSSTVDGHALVRGHKLFPVIRYALHQECAVKERKAPPQNGHDGTAKGRKDKMGGLHRERFNRVAHNVGEFLMKKK
jgi:hypothetical protein